MKGKGPLLAAIGLGVVAALLYWLDLSSAKKKAQAGWELRPVLVAAEDIDEGTVITAHLVAQFRIPKQFVTASIIPPEQFNFISGQKLIVPLKRGDPLSWPQFELSKGTERLSKAVQKNFRAITIAASEINGVGGWIRPNDHVDILLAYQDSAGGGQGDKATITVLQNMLVMATGKLTGSTNMNLVKEADRNYSNVTLLLLPEEAEMISLAQDVGKISLVLRNDEDLETQSERQKTTLRTLLTGERAKILETKRKQLQGIQMIH